jgi:endonuclease YncB( thermonuclease family)
MPDLERAGYRRRYGRTGERHRWRHPGYPRHRIRLWGIDAPESDQLCRGDDSEQYRCGAEAANDLDAFIARRPVSCNPINLDRYGRTVATCSVAGIDLGEWLVNKGIALDWPQYSRGRYGAVQRRAEEAGQGLWKGSYVEPWLYRVCIRDSGKPTGSDDANNRGTAFGALSAVHLTVSDLTP